MMIVPRTSTEHQLWLAGFSNVVVAQHLEEVAQLLADQGANPFRVKAYRKAAETLHSLKQPIQCDSVLAFW